MVHPKPDTAERRALYGYLLGHAHDADLLPASARAYEALAENAGAPLLRDELQHLVERAPEVARQLAIVAYARELGRRSSYRGQGRPVLALWREFAWRDRRPIRSFELSTQDVLDAEEAVREAIHGQLPDSESAG
jgi:hypothetical protein